MQDHTLIAMVLSFPRKWRNEQVKEEKQMKNKQGAKERGKSYLTHLIMNNRTVEGIFVEGQYTTQIAKNMELAKIAQGGKIALLGELGAI